MRLKVNVSSLILEGVIVSRHTHATIPYHNFSFSNKDDTAETLVNLIPQSINDSGFYFIQSRGGRHVYMFGGFNTVVDSGPVVTGR